MKVVCLIIANPLEGSGVWDELQMQWLRYMNTNPEIRSYFIMFDNNLDCDYVINETENTITFIGKETYTPGIYEKTIMAMQKCLSLSEFSDVTYFIRTNISAFWIWDRLLTFLKDKPTEKYVSTGLIMDRSNILAPHGSNMILSRDVVVNFSKHFHIPAKYQHADDLVLGILCKKYDITITKYKWLVTSDIIYPEQYVDTIKNIDKNVFMIRNNLFEPKMRALYESKRYSMLVDAFYENLIYPDNKMTSPNFNVLIATVGRPSLQRMLDSLSPQLTKDDCLTVVFDGHSTIPTMFSFSNFQCKVNLCNEPVALGWWGHAIRNKYASLLEKREFVMHADDDDIYLPNVFSELRQHCVNKNTLYIARMQLNAHFIVPQGKYIASGFIGTPSGIIPYDLNPQSEFLHAGRGDFSFYEKLEKLAPSIEYLDTITYRVRPPAN